MAEEIFFTTGHFIGCDDGLAGNFIKQFSLSNASTVKRGVETLLSKELIYKKEGQSYIYDVFFPDGLNVLKFSQPQLVIYPPPAPPCPQGEER